MARGSILVHRTCGCHFVVKVADWIGHRVALDYTRFFPGQRMDKGRPMVGDGKLDSDGTRSGSRPPSPLPPSPLPPAPRQQSPRQQSPRQQSLEEMNRRLAKLEGGMRWLVAKLSQSAAVAPPPVVKLEDDHNGQSNTADKLVGASAEVKPSPASAASLCDAAVAAVAETDAGANAMPHSRRHATGKSRRAANVSASSPDTPALQPRARTSARIDRPRTFRGAVEPSEEISRVRFSAPADRADSPGTVTPASLISAAQPNRQRVKKLPAWIVSLTVHAVVLLLLGLMTFALREQPAVELIAVANEPYPDIPTEATFAIQAADSAETASELLPTELADPGEMAAGDISLSIDSLLDESTTDSGSYAAALDDFGAMGTQESGHAAQGVGRGGESSFFGAGGAGSRVAFVVDGSNSMVGGRFETTLLEIARSVDALREQQFFFVVIYSDMAYPMFHPEAAEDMVAATPDHKQRLKSWLQSAEMCTGGRVADALEMALELRPQLVYLLSDGEMNQRAVRALIDLAQPGVTLHTLGMTVSDVKSESNLRRVAAAHGGTFSHVAVNPVARDMARRQTVRKNRTRGEVWGRNLPVAQVPSGR